MLMCLRSFASGFAHIPRGFAFLFAHPRLWIWALFPTAINLLILVAMLVGFIHYYGDLYGWLSAHLTFPEIANPTAWYDYAMQGLLWIARFLFQLALILTSLILISLGAYAASFVVAGPFHDALSERVERIAVGYEPPPFSLRRFLAEIFRVLRVETIKALIFLAIPLALLAVHLIPVVGGMAYLLLAFLFGAWDLGFAFADLPAGRRASPFRERWLFARRHFWTLAGFGAGFAIPFFTLLFSAPMVVGGTLLYLDLQGQTRDARFETRD